MPVVEYKFHRKVNSSGVVAPPWIEAFADDPVSFNPVDNTHIGWIKPSNERKYYVPDTVSEISKAQLVTRSLEIHNSGANNHFLLTRDASHFIDGTDYTGDPVPLSNNQVTLYVESWYDWFVNDNSGS